MATYYLSRDALEQALAAKGECLFFPRPTGRFSWMDLAGERPDLSALSQPRSAQSHKSLLFPATESLGRYGARREASQLPRRSSVVVGVRACELRAREYLDRVLLGGAVADPLYAERRERTATISCDCVDCAETCCCTLVGGLPYATEGFDVNLTPVGDGFVADVATDRGADLLGDSTPTEASSDQLARRERLRQEMVQRLKKQNARFGFEAADDSPPVLPDEEEPAWRQFAADCVECGACTHVCPTCHCFYLYDQTLGPEQFERVRTWDSCLLSTYHRMAGGAGMKLSPRPRLSSRLANRVLHKFTYSPKQYAMLGCVGCGRCIEACLGAIDIRQVVASLGARSGQEAPA